MEGRRGEKGGKGEKEGVYSWLLWGRGGGYFQAHLFRGQGILLYESKCLSTVNLKLIVLHFSTLVLESISIEREILYSLNWIIIINLVSNLYLNIRYIDF